MDKERYKILYKYIAKPVYSLAMTYACSATIIDNKLVDKDVLHQFNELKKVIDKQLEKLK